LECQVSLRPPADPCNKVPRCPKSVEGGVLITGPSEGYAIRADNQERIVTGVAPSLPLGMRGEWVLCVRPPLGTLGAFWQRGADDFLDFLECQAKLRRLLLPKMISQSVVFAAHDLPPPLVGASVYINVDLPTRSSGHSLRSAST